MAEEHDKIIRLVQSSTRNILNNYRERAESLSECSEDVKLLIREGHDPEVAQNTAERLFGTKENISFLAIDGTKSQDEALEMVIFYAGAFGYISKLNFNDKTGCSCNEPTAVKGDFKYVNCYSNTPRKYFSGCRSTERKWDRCRR